MSSETAWWIMACSGSRGESEGCFSSDGSVRADAGVDRAPAGFIGVDAGAAPTGDGGVAAAVEARRCGG